MALDFPANPSNGQSFTGAGGGVWIWDGAKWVGAGGGGAYLPLSGGTVSGALVVQGQTTLAGLVAQGQTTLAGATGVTLAAGDNSIGLATTAFVKSQGYTTGAGYLPLTGGTLTGPLSSTYGVQYPTIPNGGHMFGFAWDGALHSYVDNTYIGRVALYSQLGAYLPLSGGNLTGRLSINPSNGTGVDLLIVSPSGSYMQIFDDGNSHIGSTSTLWISAQAVNQGGVFHNTSGRVLSENANNNPSFVCHWPGNYAAGMFLSSTNLFFGNMYGDGTYGGVAFAYFASNGRFYPQAGMTINDITCNSIAIYGGTFYNAYNNGWLYFSGSLRVYDLYSENSVNAAGSLYVNGCQLYNNGGVLFTPNNFKAAGNLDAGGGAVYLNGMYIQNYAGYVYTPWSFLTNGDLVCTSGLRRYGGRGARMETWGTDWDLISFTMSGGNFLFSPDLGASGYYVTPSPFSDARLKSDIRDTEIDALAAVVATPVRAFSWNEEGIRLQPHITEPQVPIGFVAQEVAEAMPDVVELSPFGTGDLHITDHKLTPYLVRAIQQLAARVAQLEEKS